jgi:class 3 adenylate cyclase
MSSRSHRAGGVESAPSRLPSDLMHCAKCGFENPDGAKFCIECASPFARRCGSCGTENPPGAKFCLECSKPLDLPPADSSGSKESSTSFVRVSNVAGGAPLDGERKTVTALFADIKGSTELMEDLDPEEARAIIDPALSLMIDAAHRYDGYVVQSTGDGIFALFGAPLAHEDHPQRALYAALRMQEELKRYSAKVVAEGSSPIQGRVGINTGEVVVRSIQTGAGQVEYTPIGHTTNLASRMQTAAPVGSIAVSENTRRPLRRLLHPQAARRNQGQRRQRAGQRLRGHRAGAVTHAVAAFSRAWADEVRRARARDGRDEACGRTGQSWARTDRRRDGGAGGSASRDCSMNSRLLRNPAGWCWRRSRFHTARRRPICR